MPQNLLVERALALIPDSEEFLPFTDAVIGTSKVDHEKIWARSGAYATLGKRIVDPASLREVIPQITERVQDRLQQLFTHVLTAIQQQEAGDPAGAAETLIRAGEMEEGERRLDKAERIYQMALEIARDLREKGPHIIALRRLGRVTRTAGRLEEAWSWYEQSYVLSENQLDLPGQVIACQGLGNLCDDWGQREQAQTWYERGLRLAHGLENPQLEWPFYTNLSILALKRGALEEADALLERAHARIEATGDEGAMLYCYNNRGLVLLEGGDLPGAEQTFRQALARGTSPLWEVLIRVNLGLSLVRQERLFEAEEEARRAEERAILSRLVPYLVDVYLLFGRIARSRCDEEGFVFFEQALNVCRERGLPQVKEAWVYHEYGLLHLACSKHIEAQAYLEQARRIYAEIGMAPELNRVEEDLRSTQKESAA
ncbi:MAG TPA: tetratricopeptide repeat protein [Longimicrobiaceae bacterium]|nr:tetratricopeptide repeat protein [Longimicrobiaceae bacterium]